MENEKGDDNNDKPKNKLDRNSSIRTRIINSFNLNEENFFKKYYCDRETLFQVCLPYIQSPTRNKEEKKFISLYLYHIKKFTILLKTPSIEKFNQSLNYVAENLIYENVCKNKLIMRYGDKSDNFYINLSGLVSIIIPIKVTMSLNLNEYNRYIALLILYEEFELVRLLLKENKSEFSLDIPDLKFILQYLNKNKEENGMTKKRKHKLKNEIYKYGSNSPINIRRYSTNFDDEDELTEEEKLERYYSNSLENFMMNNLTKEEFAKFCKMKSSINFEEKTEEIIEPENYINRIKNFKVEDLTDIDLIKRFTRFGKIQNGLYEKKHPVVIYIYREIVKLESGDTFGDITMNGGALKRTATIIALRECHFGCLNKAVFTIVKETSEKKRKEKINFLCHIKLFKTISIKIMAEKYFNFFAFKESVLDEYIIKKGEINNNLIIIKSGIFEVNFTGKIKDIFYLMDFYKENYKDNYSKNDFKKYKLNESLVEKINKLNQNKQKILYLLEREGKDNHKNNTHKLFILNNLAIFGLKETEQKRAKKDLEEFISILDIRCRSIEGEYALLDKKIFYKQIYGADYRIKDETKAFVKDFAENTIKRLGHILYCKIWNLLTKNENQIYKYIKKTNIQENEKDKSDDLIADIGLDLDYMNKNDLTKIEYIIDKIFSKYNDNAFDIKYENLSVYDYPKKIQNTILKKNEFKLEEKKCDKDKFLSVIKSLHKNKKIYFNRLGTFKTVINKGKTNLIKSTKINKQLNLSQEYIINNKNKNNSSKNINYNNINSISNEKENEINNIKKNIMSPKRVKIKLKRSASSYGEGNNRYRALKIIKFKKTDLIQKNSSNTNTLNSSAKKINLNKSMKLSKSSTKFQTLDSIYSNYGHISNAYVSKINFSLIKYESTGEKKNVFNNIQNFKRRCNYSPLIKRKINNGVGIGRLSQSVKNTNYSNGSFFDSTQISKDSYAEKRKIYVLKNTRNYFTRNNKLVLSKIVKKMEDKMV